MRRYAYLRFPCRNAPRPIRSQGGSGDFRFGCFDTPIGATAARGGCRIGDEDGGKMRYFARVGIAFDPVGRSRLRLRGVGVSPSHQGVEEGAGLGWSAAVFV